MGYADFMKDHGDKLQFGANLIGNVGDGLGIASAFTEGKTSDGLGLGAGIAGLLSNATGIFTGAGDIVSGSKTKGGLDIFEGILGGAGNLADITASGLGLAGQKKGKGISQIVSGGIGMLSGLLSGGRAIASLIRGKDESGEKVSRADSVNNLVGAVMKVGSGIVNVGQGNEMRKGKDDAGGWDTASKVMSIAGFLSGGASSLFSAKNAFFGKKKP